MNNNTPYLVAQKFESNYIALWCTEFCYFKTNTWVYFKYVQPGHTWAKCSCTRI